MVRVLFFPNGNKSFQLESLSFPFTLLWVDKQDNSVTHHNKQTAKSHWYFNRLLKTQGLIRQPWAQTCNPSASASCGLITNSTVICATWLYILIKTFIWTAVLSIVYCISSTMLNSGGEKTSQEENKKTPPPSNKARQTRSIHPTVIRAVETVRAVCGWTFDSDIKRANIILSNISCILTAKV